VTEIERILKNADNLTERGRQDPSCRKDLEYVTNLIYNLEEAAKIIRKLTGVTPAGVDMADDVLTISMLNDIMDEIQDRHLCAYFTEAVAKGLGVDAPKEPLRIEKG
jgi:hypothetical protein